MLRCNVTLFTFEAGGNGSAIAGTLSLRIQPSGTKLLLRLWLANR